MSEVGVCRRQPLIWGGGLCCLRCLYVHANPRTGIVRTGIVRHQALLIVDVHFFVQAKQVDKLVQLLNSDRSKVCIVFSLASQPLFFFFFFW